MIVVVVVVCDIDDVDVVAVCIIISYAGDVIVYDGRVVGGVLVVFITCVVVGHVGVNVVANVCRYVDLIVAGVQCYTTLYWFLRSRVCVCHYNIILTQYSNRTRCSSNSNTNIICCWCST